MDAAPGPDNLDSNLRLSLVADPKVLQLRKDSGSVDLGVNDSTISIEVSYKYVCIYSLCTLAVLCIQGQYIANVEKEEITVMVGRDQCVVETIGDAVINCYAPQRDGPVIESVTVRA